jgi:hypothetical protein
VNATGTLGVEAKVGAITQTTGPDKVLATGVSTLKATTDITLANVLNDFVGVVTLRGVDTVIWDANTLLLAPITAVDVTGNLVINSGASLTLPAIALALGKNLTAVTRNPSAEIKQSGPLVINGTSTFTAGTPVARGNITLTDANNDFTGPVGLTGATVKVTDKNGMSLASVATGDLTADATGPLDLGSGTVTGNLSAISHNSPVTQTGPLVVSGTTTVNTGTGKITLTDAANDFKGVFNATGGTVAIRDLNSILFGVITAGVSIEVDAVGGSITQTAAGTVSAPVAKLKAGSNIVLANVGNSFDDLQVVGAANVAIRDIGDTNGKGWGLQLTGANQFTGTGFVIVTTGGLRFVPETRILDTDPAGAPSNVVLIGGQTKGPAGTNEISGNIQPNEKVAAVNLSPDLDVAGSDTYFIGNSLQSSSSPLGSYIGPIHGVSQGDPIRNMRFNYALSPGGVDGILADFGSDASLGSLGGLNGDTTVFFISAPYIDLEVSDAAAWAREMMRRDVMKTRIGTQGVVFKSNSATVSSEPITLEYFGPFWTVGYEYEQYVNGRDAQPAPLFPLFYYMDKDGKRRHFNDPH